MNALRSGRGIFDTRSSKIKPSCPRLYFGLKWNYCESEFGWASANRGQGPFSYEHAILGLLRARDFRISGCGLAATLRVAVPLLQGARAITVQPTIIIVDDDLGIRESLEGLLRSVGLQVRALASVPEFVKEGRPEGPACLVLDVRLPGRSGLDFQRELSAANGSPLP